MWKVHLLRCEILFCYFSTATSLTVFLSGSFARTLLHSVFLLYGSEKWSWWLTFQPVQHQKRNDNSVWMILIVSFLPILHLLPDFFSPRIFLPQKADVGVEEVSRCVQSRRTVWAHTPNPQSPRVYLQVYRSFTHALLAVSTFFSVLFLDPRQCK